MTMEEIDALRTTLDATRAAHHAARAAEEARDERACIDCGSREVAHGDRRCMDCHNGPAEEACPECHGNNWTPGNECYRCGGSGRKGDSRG